MCGHPYDVDTGQRPGDATPFLDVDLTIQFAADRLNVAIDVAVITTQEVADFVAGLVLSNIATTADYFVRLARQASISTHPANATEHNTHQMRPLRQQSRPADRFIGPSLTACRRKTNC
jgi:hypothetical protein